MNIGLGFLVEVVAFVAAAYVVVALRPRYPRQMTDLMLAADRLRDRSRRAAVPAGREPHERRGRAAVRGALLVAHVRVWDAVGVTLPGG